MEGCVLGNSGPGDTYATLSGQNAVDRAITPETKALNTTGTAFIFTLFL